MTNFSPHFERLDDFRLLVNLLLDFVVLVVESCVLQPCFQQCVFELLVFYLDFTLRARTEL
jgi:hypothetical protein